MERMKEKCFLKKAVFPIVPAMALMVLFYPLCVESGACDYWKLWIFAGIPFGIHRLYFRLIPKGSDLGGYLLEGQSAAWCLHGGLPWRYSGLRKEFCQEPGGL